MANPEHLAILKQGVEVWNKWREENPDVKPDLRDSKLKFTSHVGADLRNADLSNADLFATHFFGADLRNTNLSNSDLSQAILFHTNLEGADLSNAKLVGADLCVANLSNANLYGADVGRTNFQGTNVNGADFTEVKFGMTRLVLMELQDAKELAKALHNGGSSIGVDTIYKSRGKIPRAFLLGCGIPQSFIDTIPSLIKVMEPFQYNSCFISYSTKDDEFAKRLHSRLRDAGVGVWFALEEMKGGKKIHEQIEQAIQVHDRLLLVLSEHSIKSNWVETEIRRAFEVERRENRRKLFPILLTDFETIRKWKCFDGDSGRDLATEVREYFMPDFSNWKNHDSFEKGFERLLRDLKDAE